METVCNLSVVYYLVMLLFGGIAANFAASFYSSKFDSVAVGIIVGIAIGLMILGLEVMIVSIFVDAFCT